MAKVRVNKKDDFEKIFKRFKIQCKREGILREYRERQYYIKPSNKRRRNIRKKR